MFGDSRIKKEKEKYFSSFKDYLYCFIVRDHTYYIWKYVKYLRQEEKFTGLLKYYFRRKKNVLGMKLGLMIEANTCDDGLRIWHYGSVIINGYAHIGKNCVLHGQNCIGNSGKASESGTAPIIGDNVDIGVSATIIGNITIADNIKIGAGAVVTKSFLTPGVTLVGIPAREIKTEIEEK